MKVFLEDFRGDAISSAHAWAQADLSFNEKREKRLQKQPKMALIRIVFSKMFQRWPCQEDAERVKICCQEFS